MHLELPELVFWGEREEKMEVMFTGLLKSVAEIPIAAGFYSRACYALPHNKKPIFVSLQHLNMSQKRIDTFCTLEKCVANRFICNPRLTIMPVKNMVF